MSSTVRSARSHVSACPIRSRGHQPDEVVVTGQQLGPNRVVEVSAALRSHRVGEPIRRNVGSVALRVVEVFARQAGRLSQEIQPELGVQSVARVAQIDPRKAKAFIQLTYRHSATPETAPSEIRLNVMKGPIRL